ncbi:MAG: MipA/OmpV family protein [Burkholderiaceae bacterium]
MHRPEGTPEPVVPGDAEDDELARKAREAPSEAASEAPPVAAQATAALERLILDGRYSRDNEFVIGAALSAGPSYSGASDWGYSLSPAARLTWRGYSISTQSVARATARVEQTGRGERTGISGPLRVRNRFAYGFGFSINRGRDVTEEGAALGLKSLPSTLYGRLRLRYFIDEQTTLSATLISDLLNRQQNLELPIGISRRYILAERMVVAFDAALNIVNRRSMDNDYGIGPQQSAASGLPVYSPSAGLREFAVSATLVHEPDNHWVWMTRFSLVRLVGEAAASPLVKQKLQPNLMFGLAYRFTWD